MKSCRNNGGYAILLVMGFALVLSLLLAAAYNYSSTEIRIAARQGDIEEALYVAQGAVEQAVACWAKKGKAPWSTNGVIGRGTYVVAIVPSAMLNDAPRTITGWIDIDPSNSGNYFNAQKADGSIIDDGDLSAANSSYAAGSEYFRGSIVRLHFKPGGTGAQTTLNVDGNTYSANNQSAYDIFSPAMNVTIYKGTDNKWKMAVATACASFITGSY